MRFHWGLKLFSTNVDWLDEARPVLERAYQYIELYAVPGSLHTLPVWRALNCPFVIHAPHSGHGVNLSDPALRAVNRGLLDEARRFADALNAPHIIVHGGMPPPRVNGLAEVLYQADALNEPRLVLENTPMLGLDGRQASAFAPSHLQAALAGPFGGCVLDMGHAVYAAHSLAIDPLGMLRAFLALSPCLFHIADGVLASDKDIHLNIGHGDFPLPAFLALLPENARLTVETPKKSPAAALDDALALSALAEKLKG